MDFKHRTWSRADVSHSSGQGVFWRRNDFPKANTSNLPALWILRGPSAAPAGAQQTTGSCRTTQSPGPGAPLLRSAASRMVPPIGWTEGRLLGQRDSRSDRGTAAGWDDQSYFSPLTQVRIWQMTHFRGLLAVRARCDGSSRSAGGSRRWLSLPKGIHKEMPPAEGEGQRKAPCPMFRVPEDHPNGTHVPTEPRSTARAMPAPPHPSRQSWSSSQWDTAEKDKRKDSKNKTKTPWCPIPLQTEAASETTSPSARMGAEQRRRGCGRT